MRNLFLFILILLHITAAQASYTSSNPYMYAAPGGGSPSPLGGAVSSTVFDLDATVSASYGGSGQTWANYEDTPADSSSQTAYDVYLGATSSVTTDDPTFNGSAGDAGAYFSSDGGDEFRLVGSVTTYLQSLHKQGTGEQDWWIAFAFRYTDNGAAQYLFGTTTGSRPYIDIGISNTDKVRITQWPASGNVAVSTTGGLTGGTDYLVLITHDSVGNNTKFYLSSLTEESISQNFTANTTNATTMSVLRVVGTGTAPSGTRLYGVSGGNAYIGDTEFQAICDEYELRHARTYC
jgi:hypothetical protein